MKIESEGSFSELIGNEGYKQRKKFIIGGGSNVFFENNHFDGIILHPVMKGIEIIDNKDNDLTKKESKNKIICNSFCNNRIQYSSKLASFGSNYCRCWRRYDKAFRH